MQSWKKGSAEDLLRVIVITSDCTRSDQQIQTPPIVTHTRDNTYSADRSICQQESLCRQLSF
jgi:hypothetical protein